jgi:hypothetical protein
VILLCVIFIVFFLFDKEYVCALLYSKGLKPTFDIREVIGLRGMPLLLSVWLSWVCYKPSFSGRFIVVILVVK